MPVSNMKHATAFNRINALSFHAIDTYNQPAQPIKDKQVSRKGFKAEERTAIAISNIPEAPHLTYQSVVNLGVALLYILLLFSTSSFEYFI